MGLTVSSLLASPGGDSQKLSANSTSVQSSAITSGDVVVTPTGDCFYRAGSNPIAVADGTDQLLLGGNSYRISGIRGGDKLAFVTAGAAISVYITPGV